MANVLRTTTSLIDPYGASILFTFLDFYIKNVKCVFPPFILTVARTSSRV